MRIYRTHYLIIGSVDSSSRAISGIEGINVPRKGRGRRIVSEQLHDYCGRVFYTPETKRVKRPHQETTATMKRLWALVKRL
jgi:hypothetical protein